MKMGQKLFPVLVVLTCFCSVRAFQLTKDIQLTNSELNKARPSIDSVANLNLLQIITDALKAGNITAFEAVQTGSGGWPDIVAALNGFLKANVLRIEQQNVIVDPDQLEQFMFTQARTITRIIFPENLWKRLILYANLSEQIRKALPKILPELQGISIPVRSVIPRANLDLGSLVLSLVKPQLCAILSNVYNIATTSLTNFLNILRSVAVEGSGFLQSILSNIIGAVVNTVETIFANVTSTLLAIIGNTCEDTSDSTAVAEVKNVSLQRAGVGGVLQSIWQKAIAPVLRSILKGALNAILPVEIEAVTGLLTSLTGKLIDAIDRILGTNSTSEIV